MTNAGIILLSLTSSFVHPHHITVNSGLGFLLLLAGLPCGALFRNAKADLIMDLLLCSKYLAPEVTNERGGLGVTWGSFLVHTIGKILP